MPQKYQPRKFIEQSELILEIAPFMRDKVKDIRPGNKLFDVLPCGLNVWTDCRDDGVYVSIGNDREILRTYLLAFDSITRPPYHRCQYVRWKLVDSCGKGVFRIYRLDENTIGSRHELQLSNITAGRSKAWRRNHKPKISPELLNPSKPVHKLFRYKPLGMWRTTFIKQIVKGRYGLRKWGDQEEFHSKTTHALISYGALRDRDKRPWLRHQGFALQPYNEAKKKKNKRKDLDEPILGFHTT